MTEIPHKIREVLEKFGYSDGKISGLSAETLVVQDLGIWGDDFDELYDLLSQAYGTKNKIDAKYCPNEFSWMRQPMLWLPFISHKKRLKCEPLSLEALDQMMLPTDG